MPKITVQGLSCPCGAPAQARWEAQPVCKRCYMHAWSKQRYATLTPDERARMLARIHAYQHSARGKATRTYARRLQRGGETDAEHAERLAKQRRWQANRRARQKEQRS